MESYLQQKPSNCIKIVLFGPESTGKSTLAQELAKHYNTNFVKEFAREYLQEKWDNHKKVCELEDLIPIAKGQIKNENKATLLANKILFCDTDLLTTATYSKLYFDGYCDPSLEKFAKLNCYDLYLLMDIDIKWVKDDLRDRPNKRKYFFDFFKKTLVDNKKKYRIISGDIKKRKTLAIDYINNFLNLHKI